MRAFLTARGLASLALVVMVRPEVSDEGVMSTARSLIPEYLNEWSWTRFPCKEFQSGEQASKGQHACERGRPKRRQGDD